MIQKVMICGRDCHAGDANCNNYCNHDKTKPMADHSPAATASAQGFRDVVASIAASAGGRW